LVSISVRAADMSGADRNGLSSMAPALLTSSDTSVQ
jgi:hypothetical protein